MRELLDRAASRLLMFAALTALALTSVTPDLTRDPAQENRFIMDACHLAIYHYAAAPDSFDKVIDEVNACIHYVKHGSHER
jgi:hypothetical protein